MCQHVFPHLKGLKAHLEAKHQKYFCDICLEHKDLFIAEQKVYSAKGLVQHQTRGEPHEGFKGHPPCNFCNQKRFYSNVELFKHLNEKHYECELCEQMHGTQYRYYRDYEDLENHFRKDHYLCEEVECLIKKFVVFKTLLEFKAHNLTEHPHLKKESRKIDVHFNIRRTNRDGSGMSDYRQDLFAHRHRSSGQPSDLDLSTNEQEQLLETYNRNQDIGVADFPSLRDPQGQDPRSRTDPGVENNAEDEEGSIPVATNVAAPMHFWHRPLVRQPNNDDFPSLGGGPAPAGNHEALRNNGENKKMAKMRVHRQPHVNQNPGSTNFRHAVAPPPSASIRAHQSNDQWNYPALEPEAPGPANNNNSKTSRVKCRSKPNLEEQKPAGIIPQIREKIVGGDAGFRQFRENCQLYRDEELTSEAFYALVQSLFSAADFRTLFPQLMSLLPDPAQRTNVMALYKLEFHPTKAPTRHSGHKPKQQTTRNSGWNSALAQYGMQSKVASEGRLQVGYVPKKKSKAQKNKAVDNNTMRWTSERAISDCMTSFAEEEHLAMELDQKISLDQNSHEFPSSWNAPPPPSRRSKSDFPTLPAPAPAIGRSVVTRDSWDIEAKKVALDKKKKSKKKKNTMGLGDFMNFK